MIKKFNNFKVFEDVSEEQLVDSIIDTMIEKGKDVSDIKDDIENIVGDLIGEGKSYKPKKLYKLLSELLLDIFDRFDIGDNNNGDIFDDESDEEISELETSFWEYSYDINGNLKQVNIVNITEATMSSIIKDLENLKPRLRSLDIDIKYSPVEDDDYVKGCYLCIFPTFKIKK